MKYKNPGATVDMIVERIINRRKELLFVKRKHPPHKGKWVLSGGYIEYGEETLEQAASRELKEETGLKAKITRKDLFGVYSDPNRDPRGHIITHVYIVRNYSGKLKADDDAEEAGFFPENNLPELGFDHDKIIKDFLNHRNYRRRK